MDQHFPPLGRGVRFWDTLFDFMTRPRYALLPASGAGKVSAAVTFGGLRIVFSTNPLISGPSGAID